MRFLIRSLQGRGGQDKTRPSKCWFSCKDNILVLTIWHMKMSKVWTKACIKWMKTCNTVKQTMIYSVLKKEKITDTNLHVFNILKLWAGQGSKSRPCGDIRSGSSSTTTAGVPEAISLVFHSFPCHLVVLRVFPIFSSLLFDQ